MALTVTELAAVDASGGTSIATASIAPTAAALLVAFVGRRSLAAGVAISDVMALSGLGLTWTAHGAVGGWFDRHTLSWCFTAKLAGAVAPGAVTASWTGAAAQDFLHVVEVAGATGPPLQIKSLGFTQTVSPPGSTITFDNPVGAASVLVGGAISDAGTGTVQYSPGAAATWANLTLLSRTSPRALQRAAWASPRPTFEWDIPSSGVGTAAEIGAWALEVPGAVASAWTVGSIGF